MKKSIKWKSQSVNIGIAITCLVGGAILNQFVISQQIAHAKYLQQRNLLGNPDLISPLADVMIKTEQTQDIWTITKEVEVFRSPKTIEEDIKAVFGDQADNALKVARCEGLHTNKCNDGLNKDGSVDCGIFQININAHKIYNRTMLLDPAINIRIAKNLYDRQGWTPWRSSYKCHLIK